jgi:isoamylase
MAAPIDSRRRLDAGMPYPLGATWDGLGVNFAVFSAHATGIDIVLFDATHLHEVARLPLPECTDQVWHGYLPGAAPGLVYGLRAHGPYEPEQGHRFNPQKLLLDPYARKLAGKLRWSDTLFGYRLQSPRGDLAIDRRDSAAAMLKAEVTAENFAWGDDRPPKIPWCDTVIYEAHVKGLTRLCEEIGEKQRGTYAALGSLPVIDHLRRLGVTAIELMPIHAFLQDRDLLKKNLRNYWGYNTLSFFTPEQAYAAEDAGHELRLAIRRLHAAGIEVLLDVVYNHTCEGDEHGPTMSWRGLDNASYYRLIDGDSRHYANDTGTGNTLDLSHARVAQMAMDSLRYFVESFHVDGFRFDLGATLGREHSGFDPGCGFFDSLRQDPVLSRVKLISEPWDIGPGGYQLGNHPPGFSEWNDRYRDTLRRYWRGDGGQRPDLARRLSGSADFFGARRPTASINYIASHDGAPLADLVAYEGKHNEANGEDNRDGISDNLSRNWGVEGPSDDPKIMAVRACVQRAMLTTLFFSQGTPMLLAGDEIGRSQGGNNNAYCQDDEISWLDWKLAASPAGASLLGFTQRLLALRKRLAIFRGDKFLHGLDVAPGLRDLDWLDERSQFLSKEDWANGEGRALTMRRAVRRQDGRIEILALMMNGSQDALAFSLPDHARWTMLINSGEPALEEAVLGGAALSVPPHAVVLLHGVMETPS